MHYLTGNCAFSGEGEKVKISTALGIREVPAPSSPCTPLVYVGTAEGKQGESLD